MRILLIIFNFILIFVTPFAAVIMYFVMRSKNKHQYFFERFGFIKINKFNPKKSIWFHCASVGEVRSIKNIVDNIRQNHSDYSIIITTMTATGRKTAYDYIKADIAFLLPIENGNAFSKIISYMNVSCLIIVDTELWPNLIFTASSKIPVFLINARISDKTYKTYKKYKFIFKKVLNSFSAIFTKSSLDEERFVSITGSSKKVITAGNIKFQERKKKEDIKIIDNLKDYKFLLLASTHEKEEEILLSYMHNQMYGYDKIIIVPRHIERSLSIKDLVINKGYTCSLYSENDFSKQVIIIDAFGMLESLYLMADKIFIGGSIKKIGGHNIYEALQFEKVIATGINMFSFKEIYDKAKKYNLVTTIENEEDFLNYIKNENNNRNFIDFFNELDKDNSQTLSIIMETIETVLQ